jgi:hypothetical protein
MTARKPRTGAIQISDPDAQQVTAPHQGLDADALDQDIERVLDEVGESGGAVVLWREKEQQPGNFDYLVRQPAKGFTLEYVRENFGGGNYKIVPVDPQHGALNPSFFSIDRRWIGKAFSNATPAAAGTSRDDSFRDRMTELLLTAILNQRNQPAPPPPQSSANETLQIIAALAPLLKGEGGNSAETLKTMIETATMLAGAMNPPEGFAGIAAGLLPAIDKLASAHQLSARRQAVAHVLPATNTAPAAQPVATVQPPATQAQPATVAGSIFPRWLEPFRSLAPRLVSLADKDADPELYADLVIDALTDDENEAAFRGAIEAMQAGTLEQDAFSAVPQMKATEERRAWLTKFIDAVRSGLTDLLAEPEPTTDAVSNA